MSSSSSHLTHQAYECPGLNHPDNSVTPSSIGEILTGSHQIVIPVFQRKFCWTARHVRDLARDAMMASPMARHAVGKGVFTVLPDADDAGASAGAPTRLCIDGQQRLTTSMLLIGAVAQVAAETEDGARVLAAARSVLFVYPESPDTSPLRLVPSHPDRDAFRAAIVGSEEDEGSTSSRSLIPIAAQAALQCVRNAASHGGIASVSAVLTAVLDNLTMVDVCLSSETDAPQVFLWLQERALFAAVLVHIVNPGVGFSGCDLVRNYVMAPTIRMSPAKADAVYTQTWLPLESSFATAAELDAAINAANARQLANVEDLDPQLGIPDMMLSLRARIRTSSPPDWSALETYYSAIQWLRLESDPLTALVAAIQDNA